MKQPALITAILLTLAALAALVATGCGADDDFRPGDADGHWLTAVSVRVAPRSAAGLKWDADRDGWPDPVVEVLVDGTVVDTCDESDTFQIRCEPRLAIPGLSTDLELRVRDRDLLRDDEVGRATLRLLPVDAPTQLTMEPEGQIMLAEVELDRIHRALLVGLAGARVVLGGLGACVALVLLATLRRRFLTPTVGVSTGGLVRVAGAAHDGARVGNRLWRSPALISAAAAGVLGIVAGLLVGPDIGNLEPLVVAVPLGLGAYAVTSVAIDAFHAEQLGRPRFTVLVIAGGAVAIQPVLAELANVGGVIFICALIAVMLYQLWS